MLKKIEKPGFRTGEKKEPLPVKKEHIYFVKGMHCPSCEVLIEKKLLTFKQIKSVEASVDKGRVVVIYEGQRPSTSKLNEIFKRENYLFFDQPGKITERKEGNDFFIIAGTALFIIAAFFILKNSGFTSLISVNSTSSLPMFFLLGLMAGISSCAALIGGLILSLSKQWGGEVRPHLMFNTGRIVSYTILGGIIGALGSKLQISLTFTSFLIIAVSAMMVFLALQMLGVRVFHKFQFTMPKFITRYIADETNFQGKYMPLLMGALTFFLPCGFTLTAQGLALISGSAVQGALIMLSFALGTLPALLVIGLAAVKFFQRPHLAYKFLKVAGVLVLFFAFFNINNQLNVLGYPSLSDFTRKSVSEISDEGLAPIVNGKQLLKMDALSYGYSPNYFRVKVGIPVRWEIADKGTSGCTNAIISKGLFNGEISLTPGRTSIKEFTPIKAGKYKFSCWMGMVSGIIEVVDKNNAKSQDDSLNSSDNLFVPSGAEGSGGSCGINGRCGCGGR